jgi:hypothetical protein
MKIFYKQANWKCNVGHLLPNFYQINMSNKSMSWLDQPKSLRSLNSKAINNCQLFANWKNSMRNTEQRLQFIFFKFDFIFRVRLRFSALQNPMQSFLSSSTAEHVSVSTPNRKDVQKLNIRLSPIPGRNAAMFRRSEFSDTNLLSSHSVASMYRGFVLVIDLNSLL